MRDHMPSTQLESREAVKADGYYDGSELLKGVGAAHPVSEEGNGRGKQPLGFAPPRPKVELPSPRRIKRRQQRQR